MSGAIVSKGNEQNNIHNIVADCALQWAVALGPHVEQAPDLILRPVEPADIFFGLADFGHRETMAEVYRYSGMHRDEGMLIMNGPGVRPGAWIEGSSITDIAPGEAMDADCLAIVGTAFLRLARATESAEERRLFLVAPRQEDAEDPEPRQLWRLGTVAAIHRLLRLPDGRLRLLVQGVHRARADHHSL